jgi:hypothetical protein
MLNCEWHRHFVQPRSGFNPETLATRTHSTLRVQFGQSPSLLCPANQNPKVDICLQKFEKSWRMSVFRDAG